MAPRASSPSSSPLAAAGLAALAAASLLQAASATIVTDHGYMCIFNANGVTASMAQRGPNVSAFSSTVSHTAPAGLRPRRGLAARSSPFPCLPSPALTPSPSPRPPARPSFPAPPAVLGDELRLLQPRRHAALHRRRRVAADGQRVRPAQTPLLLLPQIPAHTHAPFSPLSPPAPPAPRAPPPSSPPRSWCLVDQAKCPAGSPGGTCGTLYAGLGYVDQCDHAYLVFGVAPNTQILSPAQAADPYTFYVGQTITVYIPKSQPYILQDELIRITVGAQSNTAITSTGGGGSLGGLNYTSNNGISTYTIGNSWGTGSGIQLYAAPGGNTVGKGIAPACSGNGCSPGTTSQTTTVSGMISTIMNYSSPVPPTGPPTSVTSIPNNGITILPSSLFVEDTYDAVAATYASAGPVTVNNQMVWVSFMTAGASGLATPALALYYNATSCGGGCGSTVQVTVNGKVYQRYFTTTYTSSRTKVGDNTFANGGALNYTLPSTLFTTIPGCTTWGGCTGVGFPAGNNLMWIWEVKAGGVTNYSNPFRLFMPPPPSATPSTTPSNGASQSPTPSQTGTPALSRGATASTTPSGSLSQTPSPSPTWSVTPTVSDTSRPSFSSAPNYGAIAAAASSEMSATIGGVVGGIVALAGMAGCAYLAVQRKARFEARMRMRAASRRFMGDQSSAYGRAHQDGVVNIGAQRGEAPPRRASSKPAAEAEPSVMFEVAMPQSSGRGGSRAAAPQRPAARSNSMGRR